MPRRRFRTTDPATRDRNQLDILGAPGLAGLSRMGGRSGGQGGSNIVIRGGGGPGTQIEHATLTATTGQTIAAGGAGVEWSQLVGAPTEIRGFDTLQQELSSTGAVFAIPIDVTGTAKFILDGRWASWKCIGTLTVTVTGKGGTTASRTYDLARTVATRQFRGTDDGFEVQAGDVMTFELSNGSGAAQTLAEATLLVLVRTAANNTTRPDPWGPVTLEGTQAAPRDSRWTGGTGWPDSTAYWVWSRDESPQPVGTSYFRRTVTMDADTYTFWLSADNGATLYVDGTEVVAVASDATGGTFNDSASIALATGVHDIAVEGYNGGSSAGVLVAVYDSGGTLVLHSDADWECLDYPAAEPAGWPQV